MGNWCAAVARGAFLVLRWCAREKNSGAGGDPSGAHPAAEKSAPASSSAEGGKIVAKGCFAPPLTRRRTPSPGGQPPAKDTRLPGLLVPRYEIAGMYQYVNFVPGSPFANFNSHGGSGSLTYNFSRWVGFTEEFGYYHFNRDVFPLSGSSTLVPGNFMSYLFGPRLNLRKFEHFVPLGEFLVVRTRSDFKLNGDSNQNAFAVAAGGGVAWEWTSNLVWLFG